MILKMKMVYDLLYHLPTSLPDDIIFLIESTFCCKCEDRPIDEPLYFCTVMIEKEKRSFCLKEDISIFFHNTDFIKGDIGKWYHFRKFLPHRIIKNKESFSSFFSENNQSSL